jgi:hypothetical protein
MQELMEKIKAGGLSESQAESSLNAISDWLILNYPVAATIVQSWLESERRSLLNASQSQ